MPLVLSQCIKWKEHPSPSAPAGALPRPSQHLPGTGGCRGQEGVGDSGLSLCLLPAAPGWRCSEGASFKDKRSSQAESNLPQCCAQSRSGSGLSAIISDKCFRVVMAMKEPG